MCYEEPVTADNWGGLFDGDDAANAEITDDWDKPSTASTDEPSLVHVLRHDPPLLIESRLHALRVAQELGAHPRAGGRARVLTGEDDGDHQPHDLGLGRVAPVPVPGLHQALQHVVVSGSDGGAPARPDDLGEDTRERYAHPVTLPQHRRWGVQEQKAGQIRDLLPHLVDFVKHPLPHLLPQQAPRRDQQQHLLVVPSTINIRVPTNCSMKYPCHIFDVAVMALMRAGCSNKELELAPHTRCWSAQLSNIWMGNGCYAYGELCFLWKPPWRGFICVQEYVLLQFDSLDISAPQASEISSPSVSIPMEQFKVLKMLLVECFMVNGTALIFYADSWHYTVVVQWVMHMVGAQLRTIPWPSFGSRTVVQLENVLILLDSGGSTSFVSSVVDAQLPSLLVPCAHLIVQVASDANMSCARELVDVVWSIQGHQFVSTSKVLDLQHYDLIIGMDWLLAYSPITVHWANTWLTPSKGNIYVVLYGIKTSADSGPFVQLCSIVDLTDKDQLVVQDLPPELHWLSQRELMTQAVHRHLLRAQQRMQYQADKRHADRHFSVGDMVYLKLQPYVQSSAAVRDNHKLSHKYFGPSRLVQWIGAVAYKLNLPSSPSIHLIFDVSQLKSSVKLGITVGSSWSDAHVDLQVPSQVVARCAVSRGGTIVDQVKLRWSRYDAALDTWEDEVALRQRFPSMAAWGQAAPHGGENVSPRHVPASPTVHSEHRRRWADVCANQTPV